MALNWPCCGPCLYGKISGRVSWPSTQFQNFGDTPFKQWFRISLLLVVIYWLSAWGEGLAVRDACVSAYEMVVMVAAISTAAFACRLCNVAPLLVQVHFNKWNVH